MFLLTLFFFLLLLRSLSLYLLFYKAFKCLCSETIEFAHSVNSFYLCLSNWWITVSHLRAVVCVCVVGAGVAEWPSSFGNQSDSCTQRLRFGGCEFRDEKGGVNTHMCSGVCLIPTFSGCIWCVGSIAGSWVLSYRQCPSGAAIELLSSVQPQQCKNIFDV